MTPKLLLGLENVCSSGKFMEHFIATLCIPPFHQTQYIHLVEECLELAGEDVEAPGVERH
jgi:23S rRNA A1618 N6-methylase RlmF